MKQEDILQQLLLHAQQEQAYRSDLLVKYADILCRSDARVDNVNRMIGNLIKLAEQSTMLLANLTREQEHVSSLIAELENKQRHIDHLEAARKEDNERFLQITQQLMSILAATGHKSSENTFHMTR